MGTFFSRYKTKEPDPTGASLANMAVFYSLLAVLIAIPFILIVALIWLTGILGFSAYILAAVAALAAWGLYRLARGWKRFKTRMAEQGGEMQDILRDAAGHGKDVEVSLLSGFLTVRYRGRDMMLPEALPPARPQPLALEGPITVEAQVQEVEPLLPPERLREELEGFLRLKEAGVITPEEFERLKTGLLFCQAPSE